MSQFDMTLPISKVKKIVLLMCCLNCCHVNLNESLIIMTFGPIHQSMWYLLPTTNPAVLADICAGYIIDPCCAKLVNSKTTGVKNIDELWYIGSHLVIPQYKDLWENLFHLAYNCLGHFGANKSYATLQDSYYWPNM